MEHRRAITIFWLGSAVISPAANAYWIFPGNATPVVHVYYSHHRHHRYGHYHRHRRAIRQERVILYRRYDAPVPMIPPIARPSVNHRPRPHVRLPRAVHQSAPGRRWHRSLPAVADAIPPLVTSNGNSQRSVPVTGAGQGQSSPPNISPRMAAGTGVATAGSVAAATVKPGSDTKPALPSQPSLEQIQDDQLNPPERQASPAPQQASYAPAASRAMPNGGQPRHPRTLPRLPFGAGLLALAGLGYAMMRRRKSLKTDHIASRAGPLAPAAEERSDQAPAHVKTSRSSTAWPGFNFDEVRRLDVDRVMLAPFPRVQAGIGKAAAVSTTNAGSQTERSEQAAVGTEPPSMVQHTYGEATLGTIIERYDTPEAKAGLEGFYAHIPIEFQEPVWVKVQYNGGQLYTFAMAVPEVNVHLGDEVQIVFGQQDPPLPNQVVAVVRSTQRQSE